MWKKERVEDIPSYSLGSRRILYERRKQQAAMFTAFGAAGFGASLVAQQYYLTAIFGGMLLVAGFVTISNGMKIRRIDKRKAELFNPRS